MLVSNSTIKARLDAANRKYDERLHEFQTLRLANQFRGTHPSHYNHRVTALAGYAAAVAAILALVLCVWLSLA